MDRRRIRLLVVVLVLLACASTNVGAGRTSGSARAATANLVPGNRQVAAMTTQATGAPVEFYLQFDDPSQVFRFVVTVDGKKGDLTVVTVDCCVTGDQWGVRIISKNEKKTVEACGTGDIDTFSGAATLEKVKKGETLVEVFYCQGVDLFPAGMTVRFRYTGETFTVAPQ